ncbi:MAG: AI-2E family transporter [Phycisphaerales bacterium]|nr:AI-2E family transporter [Phycisphaerales bacterium]MCI0630507.1 AI-2E family transporter [Phycisphaerales bacterium]
MGEQERAAKPDAARADEAPAMARLHIWQIQAVRDSLVILTIIGLIWAGYAMRAVTVPLLVALGLAYLFEPLVAALTRRFQASRPTVVAGLIFTIGVVVLLSLAVLIPLAIGQTFRLVDDVREGRFQGTLLRLKEVVPASYRDDLERAIHWINPPATEPSDRAVVPASTQAAVATPDETLNDLAVRQIVREELANERAREVTPQPTSSLLGFVQRSSETMFGFLGTLITFGFLAFLIPFYFFFFSIWFPRVVNFCRELIPPKNRARTLELLGKMDRAIAGFVRGRIVIASVMGVMFAIGWMLCGVPYSIVLGLVVGVFSLVPYLVGIGLPLAIGLLAVQQLGLPEAQRMTWWAIILWPSVVYVIVQVIETYILTPVIAGKATNLDPVTILVAVLAGGAVAGVYGMILAVPVAACLKIVLTEVVMPKLRAWSRGEVEDPLPIRRR